MEPKIICIPGLPGNKDTWELVLREPIEAAPNVVLLEHPDIREYDRSADYYQDCEARLAGAIRGAPGPVVLVGCSFGAYLAARVLPRFEDCCVGAVLCAGFAELTDQDAALRMDLANALETGAMTIGDVREGIDALWGDGEERSVVAAEIIAKQLQLIDEPKRTVKLARFVAELALPARRVMTSFSVPTTLIHARGDRTVPYEAAEKLVQWARRGTVMTIEGSSHMLPATHPEVVASAIQKYVQAGLALERQAQLGT